MKMIEAIDINDKIIEVPEDSCLYYTNEEDGKNYSIRVDFKETFGDIKNYMLTGYEPINVNEFDMDTLKNDEYNGKFVLKMVLEDATIIKHYFTFIGYESEEVMKLAPVKIPVDNKYTVDPTKIVSMNWYYLESSEDSMEYVDIVNLLKEEA